MHTIRKRYTQQKKRKLQVWGLISIFELTYTITIQNWSLQYYLPNYVIVDYHYASIYNKKLNLLFNKLFCSKNILETILFLKASTK